MVWMQVSVSLLVVIVVLWCMWWMDEASDTALSWAPLLALGSAWAGLLALLLTAGLWLLPWPDLWLTAVFLLFDPAAIALGVLLLWTYRGKARKLPSAEPHRLQAKVGIALGVVAVTLGYVYVMTHKTPFTPVG